MSNNFSGHVRKNADSFKPKGSGGDPDAGIGRSVAGLWPGQEPITVFEKATPVLDTAATPRTDGRGESELGLSGAVDHPNNDGGAKYTDPASIIRQTIARLSGVSGTSEAVSALSALLDRIDGNSSKADSGDPLARLEKEGNKLLETLRGMIARGSGVEITERRGGRFATTKSNDPVDLMKDALANGTPAKFEGQVVKSSFVPAETGEQRNGESAAREAMTKSLANGVNLDKLVRG